MGRPKLNSGTCFLLSCDKKATISRLCKMHYVRKIRFGIFTCSRKIKYGCLIDNCLKPHSGKGYCKLHYTRIISNPRHSKNRLQFKNKSILLKNNPRKGKCSNCEKKGITQLHHTKYDEKKPLKYTTELCPSCHIKETWRLGQLKKSHLNKTGGGEK